MERSCAQELAPFGQTSCKCFGEPLCYLFGSQTGSLLGRRLGSSLAMVRAECDLAPVHNTARRTTSEQKQSRIRKAATLARAGERGRALAAARHAPPVPVTEQICSRDQESPSRRPGTSRSCPGIEVAELVLVTLRKMPRLGEPGPLGMRAEHWYDFGSVAGDSNLFVQVVAHIAAAAVPYSV